MKAIVVSEKQFTILFDALMHKLELDALKARKELTVDDLHGKFVFELHRFRNQLEKDE